ncbi:MAG TPA: iron-containing alcohol dehydrogenase [Candidatus Dormibacteraeota bacterium]|jgi:alcohol dehydrogenase class IV
MRGVFTYANPPVIRWGPGSLGELPAELARLGGTRVAVVTTRSLAADAASILALPEAPAATVVIGQHAPIAEVERGAAEISAAGADALVSLGGGSPIDAAKVIGRLVADRSQAPERSIPHVAVPTTLSVAELASGAGVTDASGDKVGRRDPRMLPDAVIYDGELAVRTPMRLWLSTGIRALDHAIEGYLAEGDHPLSDACALEAVRRLFATLPRAAADPSDAAARTENQVAAWLSYTLPGPTAGGLSHTMGKQIGARHGIPHGVTSCLLLPHVMRYQAARHATRLADLSRATGSGRGALAAADDVQDLIARLGLPQRVSAFGLGEPELRAAAESLSLPVSAADLLEVYLAAL